ncbi:hypothetical protein PSTT_13365 [Puccinia striiformis]|uniref:Endoplasmic oxidoreductin-1 n=1 Tax=Puccinia striiformis TaxID=27350 RepID=A0A2S4URU7_9BASI|nr:hypothetical protein PSTT_13365 [Puccinia striiformis]
MHRRTKRNSILTTLILFTPLTWLAHFESPPTIPTEQLTCKPTGLIQDTSCNFETIDELNRKLHTEISAAVQLPIFRYHKVDLYQECPFWAEDGLCGNRACANDVPAFWRNSELSDLKTSSLKDIPIDMKDKCVVKEQDYCVLDGDNGMPSNGVYVDLLANPERFTGYPGKSAHRVGEQSMKTIVSTCHNDLHLAHSLLPLHPVVPDWNRWLESGTSDNETCLEKRAYYKLLSGLHTSISMHICDEYLDPATGKWVPNLQCYLNRIGLYPERLENLYFTYTLMLRALSRSASYLKLDRLIKIAHSYPVTFDETSMFKSDSHGHNTLKDEFKEHFRNVSRIMDCVGCDKCRLWGKLQVMGLATGLKLLFEYEEGAQDHSNFQLTRPELLGFINTLNRLSESLAAVDKFTKLWEQRSLEGTLPDQIKDEKLDGLASGKAAQAISLSPGLSSTPLSPFIGMAAKVEKKNDKKLQVKPEADSNSAPITSYSPPTTHTQSTNRSDSTTRSNIRSMLSIWLLLAKPASKMFKMFSEKCKHSFALCSHWFNGLLGQMKTFIHLSRSQNGNHHYQDDHIHHDPHSRSEKKEL